MTRFPRLATAAVASALALLAGACAADDTADSAVDAVAATAPSSGDARASADLHPLLRPDGSARLGVTWFSPPDPAVADLVERRWDEVQSAATVGRVLTDWIDVEPARGDYDLADLDERLGEMVADGLAPMVTIAAVDVSGTEFPEWLGGFDPDDAADAYVAMIEAALPTLRDHDVWLLAIANEPPLDDDGIDRDDFAEFVAAVELGAQELAPELAITFTFAGPDPFIDDAAIDRMIAAVDAFSVNHYCMESDLLVRPLGEATERIDAFVDRAGDLPVVFQEFGCPAGEANGSSDADQLAWFETAFDHIDANPQVRAAFVFEFLDWSDETFELDYGGVVGVLEDEVGADFVERFRAWLLTSGLVRSDGTTRPAYDLFLETAPR